MRKNNPAKGYWFVPGGRILKDELFDHAFGRILKAETGLEKEYTDARFLGIYEHIYKNENFLDDPSFSTHYITIAYTIQVNGFTINLPADQHSDYTWLPVGDLLADPQVHTNTKNYFNGFPSFHKNQWKK